MTRWIALAMGATGVLVAALGPVAAAPDAQAIPPITVAQPTPAAVPADAVGLAISQVNSSGLAVTLDAGASEEHDLVVSNHTADLRLTVQLTATDATGNVGGAAASWVAFADDAVQLDPHQATTVPMTIAVPHDTQPGPALAHVLATVSGAVAVGDGTTRSGTPHVSFPVSITVQGTPTAQIAIADVHRVDDGSHHQLALVLRNYGNQGAQVTGHVRVSGNTPQTVPFATTLPASRDTTLDLPWNAPPEKSSVDLSVDVEYGGGNTASWSSTLGGAPTNLSPTPTTIQTTGTEANNADTSNLNSTPAAAHKPWWEGGLMPVLIVIGLILAGLWFVFELRSSKRRGNEIAMPQPFFMAPPGWQPGNNDATVELAKQLVALTEIIVRLATNGDVASEPPARARSPGEPSSAARSEGPDTSDALADAEPDPVVQTRFGPPDEPAAGEQPDAPAQIIEFRSRSTSPTAGAAARPEMAALPAAPAPAPPPELEPEPDPNAALVARLLELDDERRRLRAWMDEEEAGTEWSAGAAREPFVGRPEPVDLGDEED
jgi:hypothetical protein